jgi:hypothetical protein
MLTLVPQLLRCQRTQNTCSGASIESRHMTLERENSFMKSGVYAKVFDRDQSTITPTAFNASWRDTKLQNAICA